MATAIFGSPIRRFQGETLGLTTTVASLGVVPNYQELMLYCATAFRLHLNPKIRMILFYDISALAYVNLLINLTDRASATGSGTTLDAMQTTDILYVGCEAQFGGLRVDMTASVNANASVMDAEYWNGTTWADLTETDGTASGGKMFAQSGAITWTMPTDWALTSVNGSPQLYWMRIKVSAALSADVEIADVHTRNKDTSRGYNEAGMAYQFSLNLDKVGAFEAVLAAGSDTLDVTWVQH